METAHSLYALVVIYNISCPDSKTCQALSGLESEKLHIFIYDNSVKDYGNREYCLKIGWTYLGGTGNKGLSKAYNTCIDYLKQAGCTGYLCIFDDDSSIDQDYFRVLDQEISASGSGIYAPFLYSANRILSPFLLSEKHRTVLLKDEASAFAADRTKLSAINSGMAVNLSLFDGYRYDEHIFLDGVDHSFILDMRSAGSYVHILPYRCKHRFSGDEKPPLDVLDARFRIYVKDYSYIFRNRKLDYLILVGRRMLSLTVKYRSLRFFQIFIEKRQKERNGSKEK